MGSRITHPRVELRYQKTIISIIKITNYHQQHHISSLATSPNGETNGETNGGTNGKTNGETNGETNGRLGVSGGAVRLKIDFFIECRNHSNDGPIWPTTTTW